MASDVIGGFVGRLGDPWGGESAVPLVNLPASASTSDVATPSLAYQEMCKLWQLPDDLMGGTPLMRYRGTKWLPQHPAESDTAYDVRLRRSFLLNAYRDAVTAISQRPFTNAVVLSPDDMDERIFESVDNVDLLGRSLTSFAQEALRLAVHHGLVHAYVDYPRMTRQPTLAEERALGLRPFLVLVPATDLIGWHSEQIGGVETLVQVRIMEQTTERDPDNRFGEVLVNRIRVFEMDGGSVVFQTYRQEQTSRDYTLEAEARMSMPQIPLHTFYARRTGFMTGAPVLEDMAWLNLAHWQSCSDQRNLLTFARAGILFGAGFAEDEVGDIPEIGRRMWVARDANAKLQWVEHTGSAIGSGRDDLKDLESQMAVMALRPFLDRPGSVTATEKALESAQSHANLKALIRREEQWLENLYGLYAEWLNVDAEPVVQIDDDFGISLRSESEVDQLLRSRQLGEISQHTFWDELRRRGLLSEMFDMEAERERLMEESEGVVLRDASANAPIPMDTEEDGGQG